MRIGRCSQSDAFEDAGNTLLLGGRDKLFPVLGIIEHSLAAETVDHLVSHLRV